MSKITEEEYLRLERAAEYKSEYVGGEIFAMPGGSFRHLTLIANWARELGNKLSGRCLALPSEARVRTPSTGSYVYPDVTIVCGKPVADPGASDVLTNPKVVIEVLSPSTADYDRGGKFELYREITALSEYVLVHQDLPHVEHFIRQSDGSWIFREYKGEDAIVKIDSVGCSVRLGDVYLNLPE